MKVLAGVVLMVLVIGTSKATVHPMVGSWAGMRVDGGRIEVLVADVHSSGVAVGLVCFERPLDNLMIEFGRSDHLRDGRVEGDDIVVHGDVDGSVLRFVFTSGDTARFIETFPARDKRPFETGLTRVSQHECARGVRPRALGPREDAAPLLPPLGTWFAVWPDGLVAELTITGHDDPETLTGFYCNIRTSTWSLWRLGSASRRDVEAFGTVGGPFEFEIGLTSFVFTPDGDDLRLTHQRGERKRSIVFERTDSPWCASQVAH